MILRLLALVLLLFALPAAAGQQPAKVWEASGFANPASVLWDAASQAIYVSNVNGAAPDKDGNGYISKLSPDGKVLARHWVTGLDGPKGMAVHKDRLYVADIDRLIEIDTAAGKVVRTHPAEGAKLLNDVTVDAKGAVYVSDMPADTIWRLADGRFAPWLTDARLQSPTGLKADRERLVVASWGPMDGLAAKTPGGLKAIRWSDRAVEDIASGLGNPTSVEGDGADGWLVSDSVKGVLLRVDRDGRAQPVLNLDPGAADIGTIPGRHLVLVPMMMDGTVAAWKVR
jgi:glucose/arabinose dehydrogenase